jgi:MFS family permease|tara:strand:- start:964 stop:2184 length:1221 start_codon:yes stop_codon:yes gene_type:complete
MTNLKKIYYGWYIALSGTITSFISLAVLQIGHGAFINDIYEELSWSMTAISTGFSIRVFGAGILSPLGGYLIDKFGPRITCITGTTLTFIGLILFSIMTQLWVFYLSSIIIAIGMSIGSHNAITASIMHWFDKKRGFAYSFSATGRALGYIGIVPITILLSNYGWRDTSLYASYFFFIVSLPASFVIKPNPDLENKLQINTKDEKRISDNEYGITDALKTPAFWFLAFAQLIYSFGNQMNLVHQQPALKSIGYSLSAVALIVTIFGGIQVFGRLGSGWIGDRIGRSFLLMISFLLMGVGWIGLLFATPGVIFFITLYLLFYTAGQSAHTATDQTVVADFFGITRFATIKGSMQLIALVGGITGPIMAGRIYDIYGSYDIAFIILCPVVSLGTLCVFMARKLSPKNY